MFVLPFLMFIFGLAYIFIALYLLSHSPPKKVMHQHLPGTAILIAVRNEEEYIEGCLTSLKNQDYPKEKYDVYIINDRSTDKSPEIVRRFIEYNENFHLINITEDKHGLKGKMNALAQALEQADREWVLITDADCIVPAGWIKGFAGCFAEDTAMVGGLTMLEPPPEIRSDDTQNSIFSKVQALDWLFIQTIASASSFAGKPISILGNNFAFRLDAYRQVGGFEKIGFSVTEDFALMQSFVKNLDKKIIYITGPENTIFSYPQKTVKEFFQQRRRWISGGRNASLWSYFVSGISIAAHLLMLLTFLFQQWHLMSATGIGLIIGIDYFIISRQLKKLNMDRLKKYFLLWEVFYLMYLLIFSVLYLIPKKVSWKGREF